MARVPLSRAPTRPLTATAVALTAVMGGRTGPTRPSDHVARPQNGRVVPVRPVTAVMTVKITDWTDWYSGSLQNRSSGPSARLPMTQLAEDPSPPVMARRRPGTGTPSAKEPDPDPAVKILASEGLALKEDIGDTCRYMEPVSGMTNTPVVYRLQCLLEFFFLQLAGAHVLLSWDSLNNGCGLEEESK
ncbi:hypothetical protein FB45DRAFT_872205 [Roridomyces roridus]|uniref:Uncharacterized protein n=1 Tax=Roridomyces roridus TaxID=1738132 RepID=A0AAD7BDI9_9AGAR|nr:hypothetical protein FB45DRAFT_872205 [Roridomyces roridus]